jgi:hypothetical protein
MARNQSDAYIVIILNPSSRSPKITCTVTTALNYIQCEEQFDAVWIVIKIWDLKLNAKHVVAEGDSDRQFTLRCKGQLKETAPDHRGFSLEAFHSACQG